MHMDARTIEKYLKFGLVYGLKTLEITDSMVKIEFRAPTKKGVVPAQVKEDPAVLEKIEEFKKKQKETTDLDELSIMNPEAYEEYLANKET